MCSRRSEGQRCFRRSSVIFCPKALVFLCRRRKLKYVLCFFQILSKLHFYSVLNLLMPFTKEESEVLKQAFPCVPACYIWTFDFISKFDYVFLRRQQKFKNIEFYPKIVVLSEVIYPKSFLTSTFISRQENPGAGVLFDIVLFAAACFLLSNPTNSMGCIPHLFGSVGL